MTWELIEGNAAALPIPAGSVDLIVTSPPYWDQRLYESEPGIRAAGQLGAEETPAEYVANLVGMIDTEWRRVLKPSGSLWLNLGDKYVKKSLLGLPWRVALALTDLGWLNRSELIWHKSNSIPESVGDRLRRDHETWFHLTLSDRYYSATDELRRPHTAESLRRAQPHRADVLAHAGQKVIRMTQACHPLGRLPGSVWKIPTEPITVPPEHRDHYDLHDHYAPFPIEWPRRLILGFSPPGICIACGTGRRPVIRYTGPHETEPVRELTPTQTRQWAAEFAEWCAGAGITARDLNTATGTVMGSHWTTHPTQPAVPTPAQWDKITAAYPAAANVGDLAAVVYSTVERPVRGGNLQGTYATGGRKGGKGSAANLHTPPQRTLNGYACDCPEATAPTRPAVILDPMTGTGTVPGVAHALGRHGIGVDISPAYLRLARWRIEQSGHFDKVHRRTMADRQGALEL